MKFLDFFVGETKIPDPDVSGFPRVRTLCWQKKKLKDTRAMK